MNPSKKKGEKKIENKDKLVILVDSNSVAHMVKHAIRGLSHEEMSVNVIYGFMTHMLHLANRFNSKRFVFAWDSRRSYRKELYPEYKGNRKKELTEEDKIAFEQFTTLRQDIIPLLGFKNNFVYTGYEADDIIAKVVYDNPKEPMAIITSDNDLFQILLPNNFIWHPLLKRKGRITVDTFIEDKGFAPHDWPYVKALMGDTSDNIDGIPGVGLVTATKIVNRISTPTQDDKVNKYKDIIARNLKLVTLPYPGMNKLQLDFNETHYQYDFAQICKKYGFVTMQTYDKMREWAERFGMV
jgi:DNA polymerase-1